MYEIPKGIDYIIAMPRMSLYIKYCADIFEIYLDYFSPDDIHQYSIDEAFIDVTDYLHIYKLTAKELAKKLIMQQLLVEYYDPFAEWIEQYTKNKNKRKNKKR